MPKLPVNYSFETAEACNSYEPLILEMIDWLDSHPADLHPSERKQLLKFINDWGAETPNVLLFPYGKVSDPIFKELEDDEKQKLYGTELYMSYFNGMVRYILMNPKNDDLGNVQEAGLRNVLKLEENNPALLKDSEAVKLYKTLQSSGSIRIWIDNQVRKKSLRRYRHFMAG